MKKKWLSIMMASCLAFSITLSSCNFWGGNGGSSSSPNSSGGAVRPDDQIDYTKELHFVTDGVANYVVVLPQSANEAETFAAKELAEYTSKVSSASLKIYFDDQELPADKNYISIGKTKQLEAENFNWDYQLNGDGFYMYSSDKNIFIDGAAARSKLYGVYEFIERFLGVKFVAEDYYYIPTNEDIVAYEMEMKSVPTFTVRDMFCAVSEKDFFSKCRFVDEYGYTNNKYGEDANDVWIAGCGHNQVGVFLPMDKYQSDHPEWYSNRGYNLCWTNGLDENFKYDPNKDSNINAILSQIKDKLRANTSIYLAGIFQEDNTNYCRCDRCYEAYELFGGFDSAVELLFINAIAEQVELFLEEEQPGREVLVGMFAYQGTLRAPVEENQDGEWVAVDERVQPRKNVFIHYAPLSGDFCWYHGYEDQDCPSNAEPDGNLQQWGAITSNFTVWDYQTNFNNYLFWFPNFGAMKQNYQTYLKYNFKAIIQQNSTGESAYYQNKLHAYIGAKMMWDLSLNMSDVIKEFNYYYFGEVAAPYIDQFVDLMNTHYAVLNSNGKHTNLGMYDSHPSASNYPIALLEKALGCVEDAMDKVMASNKYTQEEKAEYYRHLESVIVQPLYMILFNFDSYYDISMKNAYAVKFCEAADNIGLKKVTEVKSYADYKKELGV